mmetsp:Transcript_16114/g.41476  ORF Transcript_16114/g.41476 Transcript_16114/m.41476 type:complete len:91 (+) Transcript_16114:60-332(+)
MRYTTCRTSERASSHPERMDQYVKMSMLHRACTLTIVFTKADVAHFKWHTKLCDRPGLTNVCVMMRSSPFPTAVLHTLHVARLVDACPIV